MANTIRAAKNTFLGGLVMDLAPDTTPNEVLTSALNATLVTFNGNEMLLQNDMGNGRVETARLPEGYIPVGTCEFGDIIYIVSYNPLTNKSLIGCFPSPERNISSEEVGSTGQSLSASDFLVMDGNTPTGELKTSSVKKILYNNKLNPGDKFVIYDKNNQILNESHITDIGNLSHVYGAFPKWLKIHVIAIEDGGKINYLDSTLRWYSTLGEKDYFVRTSTGSSDAKKPDIDSYRNLLSSGYSVYQSKISGKLALLIELEKISGFDCTYSIYGKGGVTTDGVTYRDYRVFWNFSWDTEDPNINPAYVVLTKSEWSGKDDSKKGKWYKWVRINSDQVSLDGGHSMSLPINSWETNITTDISTSNYNDFINTTSYQRRLEQFLSSQTQTYGDSPLTKLNIYRKEAEGYKLLPLPGTYYINATKLIYNNGLEEVYTLKNDSGKYKQIGTVPIKDTIVNNYFNYPIYKSFTTFSIPVSLKFTKTINGETIEQVISPDNTNLIYHYEITPAMPYGLLREYSVEGYIDFSKVGTGAISLKGWRYFNGENVSNLTLGMDAYVEDNMGIQEIVLEFYDNQGMAAAYHISDKVSYSGLFTEVIPLNGSTNTYKLLSIDANGDKHLHLGPVANEGDSNIVVWDGSKVVETSWANDGRDYRLNDCGIIYSNMLYLVRIVVKYCPVNSLGEFDTSDSTSYKYFYRWMWTNTMFNQYYHNVTDFDVLKLELALDVVPNYELTNFYYHGNLSYESPNSDSVANSSDLYEYISSNVQIITTTENVTNPGGGSGGGGGGGAVDPNPEIPFTMTGPNVSVDTFMLSFNKVITEVDVDSFLFYYRVNGSRRKLSYGVDWTVSSGVGGTSLVITFSGLSDTFTMDYVLDAGAVTCVGNNKTVPMDASYSFNNGAPV